MYADQCFPYVFQTISDPGTPAKKLNWEPDNSPCSLIKRVQVLCSELLARSIAGFPMVSILTSCNLCAVKKASVLLGLLGIRVVAMLRYFEALFVDFSLDKYVLHRRFER